MTSEWWDGQFPEAEKENCLFFSAALDLASNHLRHGVILEQGRIFQFGLFMENLKEKKGMKVEDASITCNFAVN